METIERAPTFAEIGRRIKAYREKLGYTQEDLARVLKVSRPVVTKIESGKKAINALELKKISDILGINVNDLLKPVKEESIVAFFREGKDDEQFYEAVKEIENIFNAIIAQIELRERENG
ncbi:MAG TPA: helix-turn-helix transcriptional regulator [Tissierellaceae bacterium]